MMILTKKKYSFALSNYRMPCLYVRSYIKSYVTPSVKKLGNFPFESKKKKIVPTYGLYVHIYILPDFDKTLYISAQSLP